MRFERLLSKIKRYARLVDQYMLGQINGCTYGLSEASSHLIRAGGKRLRPFLVLTSYRIFRKDVERVLPLAAAVEIFHTFTLIHDDIIDEAITRRGRVSVCHGWGNSIAVLIGDFLFSKSFKLLLESGSVSSQEALAVATGQMCMGEIKQLSHVHRFLTSEAQYLETIENKTAALMAAATQSGGELAGCEQEIARILSRIGHDIGMAFQIVDDVLDYTSSLPAMGKDQGGDLRNGKLTLPLIHLLERRPEMLDAVRNSDGSAEMIERLRKEMYAEGAFEYSYNLARRYMDRAGTDLAGLRDQCEQPEGIESLQALTELILTRES